MVVEEGSDRRTAIVERRRPLAIGCGLTLTLLVCAVGAFFALRQLRGAGHFRALNMLREGAEGEADATVMPATPETTGEGLIAGRITFVTEEGVLSSIAPNGENRYAFGQEDAMSFLFPAWSPDGSRIAALGAGASGGGVYVFDDEEGSRPTELYVSRDSAPIYLYWRPDGAAVSFIASGELGLDLFLSTIDAAGDEPQRLIAGQPLYWDWLDEQAHLIVHTGTPVVDGRITFVDTIEGIDVEALENDLADPGFFQAPGVSDGGQFAAYGEVEETRRWCCPLSKMSVRISTSCLPRGAGCAC